MAVYLCKQCGAETSEWTGRCATCGSGERVTLAEQASRTGQTVSNRYKLLDRLGEGGMGAVYRAEQLGVGNQVAIKFLKPELSGNAALARRFLNEARTYIRIAHPGAVQLSDYGQDESGALYLVMELVDGVDVKRLLEQRRRLQPKEAVSIALMVADVLAHAHSKGVVHRDLKPENVMVREGLGGFHVKVLDFGIAHLAYEGAERLTQTGALAGTPKYMSPEQVRGEPVDARTDVYALGLLLFEMLTGQSAFEGASVSEILHRQATEAVPSLGSIDVNLGNLGLDLVVGKATQTRKEDRFQTMADFAAALSALTPDQLQPVPLPAAPPAQAMVPSEETDPTDLSQRRVLATPSPPSAPPRQPAPPPPPAPKPAQVTPVTAPSSPLAPTLPLPRRSPALPLVLALVVLFAGGLAGWFALRERGAAGGTPGACIQLSLYDAKWRELSVAELEDQVVHLPYMRASDARRQLETLRNSASIYAPEQRDCIYRASLVGLAANVDTVMKSSPAMWGLRVPSETLRQQFLELPLRQGWSFEERKDVLAQVDSTVLPSLKVEIPEDAEYWRRMYYGLLLTCEVSDAALEQLRAKRPTDCLHFAPRAR